MGRTADFGAQRLTDEQVATLQRGLALAAERMTDFQLLDLADALHGMIRSRRRLTEHHRVDFRV